MLKTCIEAYPEELNILLLCECLPCAIRRILITFIHTVLNGTENLKDIMLNVIYFYCVNMCYSWNSD
jgi:hypothetical protein